MHRVRARNQVQEKWLAETAEALACAERLTARLVELRGTSDIAPVIEIQAEIAALRQRVEQLERESGSRTEFHPDWLDSSAWASVRAR